MDTLRAAYNAWLERTNPLAGLSVRRAQSLYDAARAWGSPRLQYTYDEIELTDPVLLTCTERRASAIASMGWKFKAQAAADPVLAKEQRDALQTFANGIMNLTEALEHLDLAFFRGFAHVQPIWDGEKVQTVVLLKSWNFLRTQDGTWWWNPECRETPFGLEPIGPEARLVTVTRRRAIDYPALAIHIRHALGERDWGRFLERYGIPPADITMAPNATEADRPKYENTADAAKDGRNIVLPNGATVSRAGETRGTNPFLDFCQYQAKQILILATGGTLATLAEGDTGTLAGNAQENVWKQIVARDGGVISDALNRSLFRPFLAMKFPNRPPCVDFELGEDRTPTAEEAFEHGAKAKSAGYVIAQKELEEATGYTLEKDAQQPQSGLFPGLARAATPAARLQTALPSFKTASKKPDAQGKGQGPGALLRPFLSALQQDCKPLADAIKELIADGITPEKAEELQARIGDYLPKDPLTASLLAEDTARHFAEAFNSAREEHAKAKAVTAAADDREANGEFAPKGTGDKTGGKKDADKKDGEDGNEGSSGTYTAEHRSKIGQTGDWKSLGLPAMRDIPPDPPIVFNKEAEAKARIMRGETVTNPFGDVLHIDQRSMGHIGKKKRSPKQLSDKLRSLDGARETVEHPHEIWLGDNGRRLYVRITAESNGRRVVNAVEQSPDLLLSWHTSPESYDHYRHGELQWLRK